MLIRSRFLNVCVLLCYIESVCSVKKDVVFVVDKSGSIVQADFNKAIDFLADIITALTIGTNDVQVSVVSFSDTYNEEFELNDNTDQTSLLTAVNSLKTSITTAGGTFTADALDYVRSSSFLPGKGGGRADTIPIVIVMTDGLSQNTAETTTAADLLRSSITDSVIYVIGIGQDLSSTTQELLNIASDPDADHVFYVTYFEYICNLVPNIAVKIESSVSVSVAGDCEQTTTTVFVGKGGGGVVTTTTTTTTTTATATITTTTAATTTAAAGGGAGSNGVYMSAASDSDEDDIATIAAVTTSVGVVAMGAAGAGMFYRYKKGLGPCNKVSSGTKTAWA